MVVKFKNEKQALGRAKLDGVALVPDGAERD
jgi:hypothetical protein